MASSDATVPEVRLTVPGKARRIAGAPVLVAALLAALPAAAPAQEKERVAFHMMVSHVSPRPGPIDPRGESLHGVLKSEIRYESLKVLDVRVLALRLDDIGSMKLPTGRSVRLRPMDVGRDGVLVAVEVEGSTQVDLRVPNRRIVVIGGQPYEGGRLVISLEPRY